MSYGDKEYNEAILKDLQRSAKRLDNENTRLRVENAVKDGQIAKLRMEFEKHQSDGFKVPALEKQISDLIGMCAKQVEYSADLQRLIYDICHRQKPRDGLKCSHQVEMASEFIDGLLAVGGSSEERLAFWLKELLLALPIKRDWLDQKIEDNAKAELAAYQVNIGTRESS